VVAVAGCKAVAAAVREAWGYSCPYHTQSAG
jgi:hypothetical protein